MRFGRNEIMDRDKANDVHSISSVIFVAQSDNEQIPNAVILYKTFNPVHPH